MDTGVPPPLAAPAAADSFHHKAAHYAVLAILFSIAMNIVVTAVITGLGPSVPPLVRSLSSAIPGLFLISALPAGIIALAGIPKYGTKKLLWKGLVGVLLPVVLMGLAFVAFNAVRKAARERAAQHQPGN